MNVKTIAHAFGMSASEFTEYVGYSRQGLYSILEHHHPLDKRRFKAMLRMLAKKNSEMADQEFYELKRRAEARTKLIETLESEALSESTK